MDSANSSKRATQRRVGSVLEIPVRWFADVTPARVILSLVILVLLVLHGFAPSSFTVDWTSVGLLIVLTVIVLAPIIESATFPGGGGVLFRAPVVEKFTEAVAELDLTDAVSVTAETQPLAAQDSVEAAEDSSRVAAKVLRETSRSPKVGLMLLSAALDHAVRELLAGAGWHAGGRLPAIREGTARLVQLGVIPQNAGSAIELFQATRNEVIHGRQRVPDEDIIRAIDAGLILLRSIENVPRERHYVEVASVPLFAEADALNPMTTVTGVILRSDTHTSAGTKSLQRIFPTTRDHFTPGGEVAWEWNMGNVWGPAWYRDPRDPESILEAWQSSAEFVGRQLGDL